MAVTVSKRLSANDLGLTGTHQAGILIPKSQEILGFFPSLDEDRHNPSCRVTVFLPEMEEFVGLRFIHYNGKKTGMSTRDEYRLTGTTRMLRALGADEGDDLEFHRSHNGDVHVRLLHTSASDGDNIRGDVVQLSGGWRLIRT
jgi:hypothetical protein